MESFLSCKGEESYCVDVGRRVCNERRRDETVGEEGCKGVGNGCMWNGVCDGVRVALVKKIVNSFREISRVG